MLLSDPALAAMVSLGFEPAWQSVRDVPRITIDFGEGHVLRRTLHGNIATYVCAPDGIVLDVIPGLYDAETYTARLRGALELAGEYTSWPAATRLSKLRGVHAAPIGAIVTARVPVTLLSKFTIERATEKALVGDEEARIGGAEPDSAAPKRVAADGTRIDLELLARDTLHNERVRRPQIRALLAAEGRHTPESLTKTIYREVLHADLDDPYLGLGDALFGTYPFRR